VKEIWKPIIDGDIQERYAVSNLGKVIDLKNQKLLNINDNGAGYMNVGLQGPKSALRTRYVHRLVAKAFLDNPDNLPQVGHKDHTRANSNSSQLLLPLNTLEIVVRGKPKVKAISFTPYPFDSSSAISQIISFVTFRFFGGRLALIRPASIPS